MPGRRIGNRTRLQLAVAAIALTAGPVSPAEPLRVVLQDGRTVAGSWKTGRGANLETNEGKLTLESCRRIDLEPGVIPPSRTPLRRFGIRGGDSIDGELLEIRDGRARLRFWNETPIEIPLTWLDTFGPLPGERDQLFESFDATPKDWKVERGELLVEAAVHDDEAGKALVLRGATEIRVPFPRPWTTGRIALRYRIERGPKDAGENAPRFGVVFPIKTNGGVAHVRIAFRSSSLPRLELQPGARVDHQPLAEREGWRSLIVLVREGRVRVLVDGQLRAQSEIPDGTVEGLTLSSERASVADDESGPRFLVDDLQIQRAAGPVAARREWRHDSLLLHSGDELFGSLRGAADSGVTWETSERSIAFPWSDVARVALRPQPGSWHAVEGCVARVVLAAPSDHLPAAPSSAESNGMASLLGAIVSVSESTLELHHPVLGNLDVPLAAVRRIEPRYHGTLLLVDPDVHHLGTSARMDFQHPRPEGTQHESGFSLELPDTRLQRAFVAASVRDVEPAGPTTPPGSPFLAELKAGGLRTDVLCNGLRLGDLNGVLTWKRGVNDQQTVRLPVTPAMLKSGRNVLRFVQRPARSDPTSFDDCEIGPVYLELPDEPEAATR